jgi:hypothetical protein
VENFARYGREYPTCNDCWKASRRIGSGTKDALVVKTNTLSPHVGKWVQRFNKEHGSSPNGYSVWSYFKERGIDHHQVVRVIDCKYEWTSLGLADRILQAIERTDLMHTEIVAVPNPHWTQERWLAWQANCDS